MSAADPMRESCLAQHQNNDRSWPWSSPMSLGGTLGGTMASRRRGFDRIHSKGTSSRLEEALSPGWRRFPEGVGLSLVISYHRATNLIIPAVNLGLLHLGGVVEQEEEQEQEQ